MRSCSSRASSTLTPSSLNLSFGRSIGGFNSRRRCISLAAISRSSRMSVSCAVQFRPCIDIHKGKVKQIVGSTLRDLKDGDSTPTTNFETDKSPSEFANLYRQDGLTGGHVIMLGADPLSKAAAIEALRAYPGGLQVGGGITSENSLSYIDEGASHVIVTS
ncbi:hypothetical protein CRG98_037643, partial [Punica granatum]